MINGDLFDFWFEWRTVMPRGHVRVLGALAALADAGTPVVMIAGNHDAWGGEVLTREIGVQLVHGDWDGTLGGWRAHISHGDGLRAREDRRYRALKRVMRHPLAIRAFRALHPDFATRIASGTSTHSRVAARVRWRRRAARGCRTTISMRIARRSSWCSVTRTRRRSSACPAAACTRIQARGSIARRISSSPRAHRAARMDRIIRG